MNDILKKYIENRKKLQSHTKRYYLKKLIFPLYFTIPLIVIGNFYSVTISHSSISTALVSISAIIVAFLVFSMTILLTKENDKNIPNTRVKYIDILINNTELLALLSVITIIVNLVYMYISNLNNCTFFYWDKLLSTISFISIYLTLLIIKIAIDDLLFLSKSYEVK
ncbi:hypothetical protein ACMC56_16390 [Campylobacterota bacterium DY0563]